MHPSLLPLSSAIDVLPSRNAASAAGKECVYLMAEGFMLTRRCLPTMQPAAGILLTMPRKSFDIGIGGRTHSCQAAASKPLAAYELSGAGSQVLSVLVNPLHRHFGKFVTIPGAGVLRLARTAFATFDGALQGAYQGVLSAKQASRLFDGIVATTIPHLPEAQARDARIEQAMELLRQDATCPLSKLASTVGLSYYRMSHLFADTIGVPLRSYLLWQKLCRATWMMLMLGEKCRLADVARLADFTDAAHLSRTFRHMFGMPPSRFLDRERVQVVSAPSQEQIRWVERAMTAKRRRK